MKIGIVSSKLVLQHGVLKAEYYLDPGATTKKAIKRHTKARDKAENNLKRLKARLQDEEDAFKDVEHLVDRRE